tara:strand:- start:188 stop:457 length:270 start_codon:yes stop_codon:yes gene_type:complete
LTIQNNFIRLEKMDFTMLNDIRETCLETLENTYASRLEILVDGGKFDDAKSIVSEMVVDDLVETEWTFIDDMSQFTDADIPHLNWTESE